MFQETFILKKSRLLPTQNVEETIMKEQWMNGGEDGGAKMNNYPQKELRSSTNFSHNKRQDKH